MHIDPVFLCLVILLILEVVGQSAHKLAKLTGDLVACQEENEAGAKIAVLVKKFHLDCGWTVKLRRLGSQVITFCLFFLSCNYIYFCYIYIYFLVWKIIDIKGVIENKTMKAPPFIVLLSHSLSNFCMNNYCSKAIKNI